MRLLKFLLHKVLKVLRPMRGLWLNLRFEATRVFKQSTVLNSKHSDNGLIRFFASSTTSFLRAQQAHLKEPLTANWLKSIEKGQVFWDIGANVGVFSLLAASRGLRVVAMEPVAATLGDLARSASQNPSFEENLLLLNVALGDRDGVAQFNSNSNQVGYSGGQFDSIYDVYGSKFTPRHSRPVLGLSGDSLGKIIGDKFSHPHAIKIDVDGNELHVLEGMKGTLGQPQLWSVLVEVLPESEVAKKICETLDSYGFRLLDKEPAGTSGTFFENQLWVRPSPTSATGFPRNS